MSYKSGSWLRTVVVLAFSQHRCAVCVIVSLIDAFCFPEANGGGWRLGDAEQRKLRFPLGPACRLSWSDWSRGAGYRWAEYDPTAVCTCKHVVLGKAFFHYLRNNPAFSVIPSGRQCKDRLGINTNTETVLTFSSRVVLVRTAVWIPGRALEGSSHPTATTPPDFSVAFENNISVISLGMSKVNTGGRNTGLREVYRIPCNR